MDLDEIDRDDHFIPWDQAKEGARALTEVKRIN